MMPEVRAGNRFNWRWPVYAAVAALLILLPITLCCSDLTEVLYIFVAAPILGLLLLVVAAFARGKRLSILSMVFVYWAVSFALVAGRVPLRDAGRWFLYSKEYKARVLAQPEPAYGELRHVDWDSWGWGGADTVIYLVYDPGDSLAAAARTGSPGQYPGIPCKVPRVRRMEGQWYTVQFYTSTG